MNRIIPYKKKLKERARELRKNGTLSEVLLWNQIKKKALGYEFHRQVPLKEFIVDFYCHELMLAVEVDGSSHNEKYEYDVQRQSLLEELGVRFVRFSDAEVKRSLNGVLVALRDKIHELTSPQPPSKGE